MPRLTALHQAVEQGDLEETQRLLTEGADVNTVADWVHPSVIPSPTFNNITPLHIAASLGRRDMAELLLLHGADPNANRQKNSMAINILLFLVRLCFSGATILITLFMGFVVAPFWHLVSTPPGSPRSEVVTRIYTLYAFFVLGMIVAMGVAYKPGIFLGFLRLFNPLPLNPSPLTPLHLAVEYGHDHVVKLLLNYGANHNQLGYTANYEVVTPLLIASKNGNEGIVKCLLERGTSPNSMRNRNHSSRLATLACYFLRNSPLQWNFHRLILELFRPLPLNDLENEHRFFPLLEMYFFPRTPLHEAVYNGHENIVRLLLQYRADPYAICLARKVLSSAECLKMTPLHYALLPEADSNLKQRKMEIAKLLFNNMPKLSVSLLNELLHLAAESCDSTHVEALIKRGADVNSRLEKNGLTPLHRVFMNRLNRLFQSNPPSRNIFYNIDAYYSGRLLPREDNDDNEDVATERFITLQALITSKADVNATFSNVVDASFSNWLRLFRPLSLATLSCWPEAIVLLLESGAKLSLADWFNKFSLLNEILYAYFRLGSSSDKKAMIAILKKILEQLLKNNINYKLIIKDIAENKQFPSLFEQAKQRKETELVKVLYPFEICRNLGEENLLQARVKNAFEYLIQHGRIKTYHYDCIRQCQHALVQDYLRTFGNELLKVIEEESENVPTLKALVMDYILQNPELFSKQSFKKLTPDLKAELKEANISMPPLTLSYPITSQRSWQELRARHRQRQQNNLYDDEPINANDNTESEIKIKVL